MNSAFLILIFVTIIILGILILWQYKKANTTSAIDPQVLMMLQQRIEQLNQDVKGSMTESVRHQQTASFQMTSVVRDVTERLIKIEETNKQVLNFSGQLEQLQRILTNPKQRGIIGEYYLETLLKNVFGPEQYQMQYKFKDGEIVDAVLFVQDKIIPIDSKFSLENYNRLVSAETDSEREIHERAFVNDLKTRVKETSKYIRPQEGTTEFAFMFIPHEAIYYDLIINKIGAVMDDTESILQRAAAHYRVIIVSPTSFTAYLQTVMQGLKALKIEEQAKEIRIRIGDLSKHLANYEQYFQNIGKHLGTVVSQYNLANKQYSLIDKDILKITGQGTGYQSALLDKPTDTDSL